MWRYSGFYLSSLVKCFCTLKVLWLAPASLHCVVVEFHLFSNSSFWSHTTKTLLQKLFLPTIKPACPPVSICNQTLFFLLFFLLFFCMDTINRWPVKVVFYNRSDVDGVSAWSHTWGERENRHSWRTTLHLFSVNWVETHGFLCVGVMWWLTQWPPLSRTERDPWLWVWSAGGLNSPSLRGKLAAQSSLLSSCFHTSCWRARLRFRTVNQQESKTEAVESRFMRVSTIFLF